MGPDKSATSIVAQICNANGSKAGQAFQVNTTAALSQIQPEMAALTDGRFVVSWGNHNSIGSGPPYSDDSRAQIFNADGSKAGAEFLITGTASMHQAEITVLQDGNFVVSWNGQGIAGLGAIHA